MTFDKSKPSKRLEMIIFFSGMLWQKNFFSQLVQLTDLIEKNAYKKTHYPIDIYLKI
jgi:hypothetical protein